jgi:hypothetical protein
MEMRMKTGFDLDREDPRAVQTGGHLEGPMNELP